MAAISPAEDFDLSLAQAGAVRRYIMQCERLQNPKSGFQAAVVQDAVRMARAALSPAQISLVELLAVKGSTLEWLAERTARKPEDLVREFKGACDALAAHYEANEP